VEWKNVRLKPRLLSLRLAVHLRGQGVVPVGGRLALAPEGRPRSLSSDGLSTTFSCGGSRCLPLRVCGEFPPTA